MVDLYTYDGLLSCLTMAKTRFCWLKCTCLISVASGAHVGGRGAHGGGQTGVRLFSPILIAPPPTSVMFMTAYPDSDFRLIILDYSDFSSDILKEYVKKKS